MDRKTRVGLSSEGDVRGQRPSYSATITASRHAAASVRQSSFAARVARLRSSLLLAMLALAGLAGCASVPDASLTPASRAELVGHWRGQWNHWGYASELSLSDDGSFCAVTYAERRKAVSHGTWSFDTLGTGRFSNDGPVGTLYLDVITTSEIDRKSRANTLWFGEAYKDEAGMLWLADDRCPHCGVGWSVSTHRPAPHEECRVPPATRLP